MFARFCAIFLIVVGLALDGVAIGISASQNTYIEVPDMSCSHYNGCTISDKTLKKMSSTLREVRYVLKKESDSKTVSIVLAVVGGFFIALGLFGWASSTTRKRTGELFDMIVIGGKKDVVNPVPVPPMARAVPQQNNSFCPNCGTPYMRGSRNCGNCGSPLA